MEDRIQATTQPVPQESPLSGRPEELDVEDLPGGRQIERKATIEDWMHGWLARAFFYMLAGTIGVYLVAAIVFVALRKDWSPLKDLLNVILPAETALLGNAVGFYFGIKSGRGERGGGKE